MRTLGLLGGMSWESTLPYYRLINEGMRARLGGLHSARLLLWSADFHEIEQLQQAGDWHAAGRLLGDAAAALERAGAEALVLCTNTMHCVADAIEGASALPLLHIADATAAVIREAGVARVGLLGTRFTMEQAFYRERIEAQGIAVLTPGPDDRSRVHRVIYEELCRGIIREDSRAAYRDVIAGLVGRGVQGIILGCTEISLLVSDTDAAVPLFDTTAIHARHAVDWALSPP